MALQIQKGEVGRWPKRRPPGFRAKKRVASKPVDPARVGGQTVGQWDSRTVDSKTVRKRWAVGRPFPPGQASGQGFVAWSEPKEDEQESA